MKPQRVLEQGEKKRDRNSGLFFVPWENAESSFEDSAVKKNYKEYYNYYNLKKLTVVNLHTKFKVRVSSDFCLNLKGCNTYIHWVDKNGLGIGALSVRCTTLELPHVFPLKSLDQQISIF